MAQFIPAVTKVLTDAGYDVKSTVFDEQGELTFSKVILVKGFFLINDIT